MSNHETVTNVARTASAAAVRPCAFCQAETRHALLRRENSRSATYRCLLNPGKMHGPDGDEISLTACTPQRQLDCQAQRRQEFARLCATVPALRRMAL